MAQVSRLTQRQIDWFRDRGFLLGQRKSKGTYYIVRGREELEFDAIWKAQQYVNQAQS